MIVRLRISRPRSLQARTTLAAVLAAAVVFGLGAWTMRRVAYDQRIGESVSDARQEASLLIASTTESTWPAGGEGWGPFPYELVTSSRLLASTSQLKDFESGGHPFMPLPSTGNGMPPPIGSSVVRFPDSAASQGNPLAGTTITAVSDTLNVKNLASYPASGITEAPGFGPGSRVRAYVFVTTGSAEAAVADLDRVLYPAIPVAVLLVAAVAFLATRRALRPVEAIRARTAVVTASDPRERVTVPPTGDEIARLATTINTTLERLDAAAQTQRRFVADAAHELRSPLAGLLATVEVAEAYPERADWPETVTAVGRQARRIQALTEDLLLLARLEAAAVGDHTRIDLAFLARTTVAEYQTRPDTVPISCEADTAVPVEGNHVQLERLLRNLLDNASRYARTRVEVSVRTEGPTAILSVQDDGPGVAAADRERIFERFTRLDDDRSRQTGGTGLGLAIAREIAERHDGALAVADTACGARLVARLPLGH